MRTTILAGAIETTVLGFGCATLFRLSSSRARRRVLDAAYDAGFRHYDVAPMYGLGQAESELGAFARAHPDGLVLATKFGIEPTLLARGLARVQRPVRAVLARSARLQGQIKSAAAGPGSGIAGGFLYRSAGYDTKAARSGLQASLRRLAMGHVDLFLLHDPPSGTVAPEVTGYLEEVKGLGLIRGWGVAGPISDALPIVRSLGATGVLQVPFDGMRRDEFAAAASWPGGVISYGVLQRVLARVSAVDDSSRRHWSGALGLDIGDAAQLATVLVRDAMSSNRSGVVLYSTTRAERIAPMVRALEDEAAWAPPRQEMLQQFLASLERPEPVVGTPP